MYDIHALWCVWFCSMILSHVMWFKGILIYVWYGRVMWFISNLICSDVTCFCNTIFLCDGIHEFIVLLYVYGVVIHHREISSRKGMWFFSLTLIYAMFVIL